MDLMPRSVGDDVKDFSSTFTSFDKCMTKNICKIPFIVICVVGGLIVFSILWCFLRCCLCGYRCCTCCCGGCGGRRGKRRNQTDREISQPAPIIAQQPAYHGPPQYAYFDSRNDDALPVMPSLEKTQRIEVSVKEEHELAPMKPVNMQDASPGYGYDQPPSDPRYKNSDLHHPTPVREYGQDGYQGQMSLYQDNLSPASSTYSTIPPLHGMGHQENGMVHHRSNGYHESSSHLQQPQPGWNGHRNTAQNAYNDYQVNSYQYGPRHQHSGTPDYHSQRRQEEWAIV